MLTLLKNIFNPNKDQKEFDQYLALKELESDLVSINEIQARNLINLFKLVQDQRISSVVSVGSLYLTFNNGDLIRVIDLDSPQKEG